MPALPATDAALEPALNGQGLASSHGSLPLVKLEDASDRELCGVGGLPRPYYQHGGITIYHGDCRTIMPHLQPFDLLLADPPYGIGESSEKVASRNKYRKGLTASKSNALAGQRDYGQFDWDAEPVEEWAMLLARRLCRWQVIWGGNYYALPPAKCWLVWDKENGDNDFADCELAWTNLPKAVRKIKHLWNGMLRKGGEDRWHPTQKPLDVIAWALRHAPAEVGTVLDPWMGSGTTLRACKDHGKQCVGIEREEKWCEIAAKRLEQEALPLGGGGGFENPSPAEKEENVRISDRGAVESNKEDK